MATLIWSAVKELTVSLQKRIVCSLETVLSPFIKTMADSTVKGLCILIFVEIPSIGPIILVSLGVSSKI